MVGVMVMMDGILGRKISYKITIMGVIRVLCRKIYAFWQNLCKNYAKML